MDPGAVVGAPVGVWLGVPVGAGEPVTVGLGTGAVVAGDVGVDVGPVVGDRWVDECSTSRLTVVPDPPEIEWPMVSSTAEITTIATRKAATASATSAFALIHRGRSGAAASVPSSDGS